jgi:hypothetical protein
MKIRTNHSYSGGPYAWSAIDDDTYDGAEDSSNRHTIGYGATRDEAIADLQRLLQEEAESECSCRWSTVHSTDIDPPHQILDRLCPVHGDGGPDPDDLRDLRNEMLS